MDEYKRKLRNWYNKTAERYDNWGENKGEYSSGSRSIETKMFNELLKSVPIKKNTKILDVATGTGVYLIKALEKGGIGFGVDISENMLKVLENKLFRLNLKHKVKLLKLCDAFNLDFEDKFFDLILCIGLFDYYDFPDVKVIMKEMKRVGKNRCFFIVDFPNKNDKEAYKFQAAERSVGHEVFIHELTDIIASLENSGFDILKYHMAGTEIQFLLKNTSKMLSQKKHIR